LRKPWPPWRHKAKRRLELNSAQALKNPTLTPWRSLILWPLHAFLLIALWSVSSAFSQVPKSARDDELRALRERIAQLQNAITSTEAEKADAVEELKIREKSISDINRVLHELTQEKALVGLGLSELTEQIANAKNQSRAQQMQLNALLRAQQRNGTVDSLRLFLEGRDVAQAERQLHYYGYIASLRTNTISKHKNTLTALASLEEAAVQKQELLAANEVEQNRTKRQLEATRADYQKLLLKVSATLDLNRSEVNRLQKDEEALTKLIASLAKPIIERSANTKPATPSKSVPVPLKPATAFISNGFANSKGLLPMPLNGKLLGRFGAQREVGGLMWKGFFIGGKAGDKVNAVAAGRVAHADWLRGFGNLIIVDHGDTYMSLYANNDSLLKAVGDIVVAGEAIALVGNGPIMVKESGVYFEIRHEGSPVDPNIWLKRQ
jgi:murein hydrolase activator